MDPSSSLLSLSVFFFLLRKNGKELYINFISDNVSIAAFSDLEIKITDLLLKNVISYNAIAPVVVVNPICLDFTDITLSWFNMTFANFSWIG